MIVMDEDALICDFAETYHILDYRSLPARQAARLACGLRHSSRIMQALSGAPADLETILQALIADAVRVLVWQNTRDGTKGQNQPKSVLAILSGNTQEAVGFDSADDFERWRASMIGGDPRA